MAVSRSQFVPGRRYHIYNRANGSENLFRNSDNYSFFMERLYQYLCPVAKIHAYCLMPNHFHALIEIKRREEQLDFFQKKYGRSYQQQLSKDENMLHKAISQQFSNFFNSYAKAYNKAFMRRGSLFQPNVKRKPVLSEPYFKKLIHYIHNNPVHHGFTKSYEVWPHSSYHVFLHTEFSPLAKDEVLKIFGGIEKFIDWHVSNKLQAELASEAFD